MSNQFKSFFSGFFGVLLAGLIYFGYHLYQDHLLVDAIRVNINAQQAQQNQQNQQRIPQPPQVKPSEEPVKEVPKK